MNLHICWKWQIFVLYNTKKIKYSDTPEMAFTCRSEPQMKGHLLVLAGFVTSEWRLEAETSLGHLHLMALNLHLHSGWVFLPQDTSYLKFIVFFFNLMLPFLCPVKVFQFHIFSAWMERKLILTAAAVFFLHFTSIWVLQWWGSRTGIILSSGDAVKQPLWTVVAKTKWQIRWGPLPYFHHTPKNRPEKLT